VTDNAFGDFFLSDGDDALADDEELLAAPVVVPGGQAPPQPAPPAAGPQPTTEPTPQTVAEVPQQAPAPVAVTPASRPVTVAQASSREERLANALDELMENNQEIAAAALVSLDGFTMAAALPDSMQDDRVGAMSAAILGLGERAAAELGRGALTQVFIEGEGGYVMLIAAGDKAVLTCIADTQAKLGLVLYDMREAAEKITEILG
jgi:uncharacterized protein